MLKRVFFGFTVLLVAGGVFAGAYKWVDEDGIVHYSDRPAAGAEEILLPTTRRGSRRAMAPEARRQTRNSADPGATTERFSYETLIVVSPAAEETLWNIEGVLNVSLDLRPGLKQGHAVRVYFDGTPQLVSGSNFQIADDYRGVHNLQVEILDETGKLMIRSLTNRFYVQQNRITQ